MPTIAVDGMDVIACLTAQRATAPSTSASAGGPFFIEFRTYRFRAHSMFDPELYRDKAEVEHWRERDPIKTFTEQCLRDGVLTDDDVAQIEQAADRRGGGGRGVCRRRDLGGRRGSRA